MQLIKFQSSGSDHMVLVDPEFDDRTDVDLPQLAVDLCNRSGAYGADGLVVVRSNDNFSRSMEIQTYTPDGNAPGLCINGALCGLTAAAWTKRKSIVADLDMSGKSYIGRSASFSNGTLFTSGVGSYEISRADIKEYLSISVDELMETFRKFGISVEHYVFYDVLTPQLHFSTGQIEEAKLVELGRRLNSPRVSLSGINVTAVTTYGGRVFTRTYERGGAGLTLSCASAASCGAAMAVSILGHTEERVSVVTKGGEYKVTLSSAGEGFTVADIEGTVSPVYSSELNEDYTRREGADRGHQQIVTGDLFIESIARHDEIVSRLLSEARFQDWCI